MTTIYIVSTPIGNLQDITLRALKILQEVDFILSEDTRVTLKLLAHFNIKKPLISYFSHSGFNKINYILKLLSEGKKLALVSDAGTPGINDPGGKLIEEILRKFGNKVKIVPIPGPNAAIAALSISGFKVDRFLFLGYPPHKKGRKSFFQEIINSKYPVVFYESPHRILKTLKELSELDILKKRQMVVARELTKAFETIYRGTILEILGKIGKNPKGEFVVVVNLS